MSEETPYGGVVALDQGVPVLLTNAPDAAEVRIIAMRNLADDPPTGLCRVCANLDWAVQPDTLDCLAQRGVGRLPIPPRRQGRSNHLTVRREYDPPDPFLILVTIKRTP